VNTTRPKKFNLRPIKLNMIGRTDSTEDANEYYFARPQQVGLVDLSDVVFFVHPYENDDGTFGAELVIKKYTGGQERRSRSTQDQNDYKEDSSGNGRYAREG